ncbi:hypothetical protein [Streptomyces sp. NPDC127098]|uniref:hypothetical protein n=1 Tax=Streptomyces sp. NPDC127098 TaxID=3347137 RepID=UPI00364E1D59
MDDAVDIKRTRAGGITARDTTNNEFVPKVLAWVGFQPTEEADTYVLPPNVPLDEARQRIFRALQILEGRDITTVTQVDLIAWPPPVIDLPSAIKAVSDLTRQLPNIWHPDELAWHLYQLVAADDASLLTAIRTCLQTTREWTARSEGHDMTPLLDALTEADHTIRTVQQRLEEALPELNRLAHADGAGQPAPPRTASGPAIPSPTGKRPPQNRTR